MGLNTLEDKPRAERDKAYADLEASRRKLRNEKWASIFNKSDFGLNFEPPPPARAAPQSVEKSDVRAVHNEANAAADPENVFDAMDNDRLRRMVPIERAMLRNDELPDSTDPIIEQYLQRHEPERLTRQDLIDAVATIQPPPQPMPTDTESQMNALAKEVNAIHKAIDAGSSAAAELAQTNPATISVLRVIERELIDNGALSDTYISDYATSTAAGPSGGKTPPMLEINPDLRFDTREPDVYAAAQKIKKASDGADITTEFSEIIKAISKHRPSEVDTVMGIVNVPPPPNTGIRLGLPAWKSEARFTKSSNNVVASFENSDGDLMSHELSTFLFYLLMFVRPYPFYEQAYVEGNNYKHQYVEILKHSTSQLLGKRELKKNFNQVVIDQVEDWKETYKVKQHFGKIYGGLKKAAGLGGATGRKRGVARGITLDTETGALGDRVVIDISKLTRQHKLVARREQGVEIREKLDADTARDLYDLLAKRYAGGRTYTAQALELFEKLRELAQYPTFGPKAPMSKKAALGARSLQYYTSQDLIMRMKVLVASIHAGNAGRGTLNELSAVLDQLLSRKVITEDEYAGAIEQAQRAASRQSP